MSVPDIAYGVRRHIGSRILCYASTGHRIGNSLTGSGSVPSTSAWQSKSTSGIIGSLSTGHRVGTA
eukprot:1881926-Rhodomonas_salina.2